MFQKRYVRYLVAVIVLVLICFICRDSLLQIAFRKMQQRVHSKYSIALNASSIHFSGLDGVSLKRVSLQPDNADTLARVEEVFLNLSLLDLLTGKIGFDEIKIQDVLITVYDLPERDNRHFRSQASLKEAAVKKVDDNYRKLAVGIKSKLIRAFNTAFKLREIRFLYQDSATTEDVLIPSLKYDRKNLSGLVINQVLKDTLTLGGEVLQKGKSYQFTAIHSNNSLMYLPFLDRDRGLKCRFKSVKVSIEFENAADALQFNTSVFAEDFHINHWRLANDDVVFGKAEFNGRLNVSENGIELDSASIMKINGINTHLFAGFFVKPDTVFTVSVRMPETVSDTFFTSLPQGMFNTLKGISCTGSLQYDLFFTINARQPDSLVFISNLQRKNFGIKHYGVENYERMNGPFTYAAYDKDRFMRNIEISPANPSFTPLNRISEYLKNSVMQSEDPSFMLHRGFLPEAFRESVIKNYRERRFARGGSTISMQLVKNVFLSRDKTVSRKAEEALIVYLIENLHLVGKERMLEVYLNVIEWGPNVYGVGEASRFYFNKTPAELNLQESIFLAGIIPAPKFFKYQFDKEGKMKPYLSGYFRILTGRMASKGWISAVDTSGLLPDVKLKGPALRMIVPSDSVLLPAMDDELPLME